MPHNAPDEVAIASTRISGSIGAMSEQPIVDEWLDERLGLFDLINIAGRGERCKLRQDRNPPVDAANRVTPLTKRRDILVNLRPEPATIIPSTVCGLTKKRSNMATSIPK
ncbi:hypothetical protein NKJ36_31615 [Mesorhizobium sp. M0142]|uniref:hypothetical protein n=1 Tax=Mesorhizobium sp. M0142 TaxID=2956894 RepID=UPI003338E455